VVAEQVRHAFLFGCNVFPVLDYEDAGTHEYGTRFAALLNYATLPFYWGSYEAEPGKTREAHLRRMAAWCAERGIAVKGHPLVWHEVWPKWGPMGADEAKRLSEARVRGIVGGFAGLVDRWDVVNEATVSERFANGVGAWAKRDGGLALVRDAVQWAREANPKAVLLYNDYNIAPEFEKLVLELPARTVDAIGIQSHMHQKTWTLDRVWEVCETYARFGRPLHFTELTVLSGEAGWLKPAPWPTTPEGEAAQAAYVSDLYTLLFSHPAVEAITWWDFVDGAWQGAPAGLLRADLAPKPAYDRLLDLVRRTWWTDRAEGVTDAGGRCLLRGFAGGYRVRAAAGRAEAALDAALPRGGASWEIRLPG
jgi:GH35 family endo-1,4-beta-xylanase